MIKTFTDFLRKLFTGKHNSPFKLPAMNIITELIF